MKKQKGNNEEIMPTIWDTDYGAANCWVIITKPLTLQNILNLCCYYKKVIITNTTYSGLY